MRNSQAGQDVFVLALLNDETKHNFVDVGCYLPDDLNNTLLLEEHNWNGVSIDILDFSNEWKTRGTSFVQADALTLDYTELFNIHSLPKVIDYLNVDIEGEGNRFSALKKVLESDREFKIITIEHDLYRGYEQTEMIPQRKLLKELGYVLVCGNVHLSGNPFEDWWINPKYINENKYQNLICENCDAGKIIDKLLTKI